MNVNCGLYALVYPVQVLVGEPERILQIELFQVIELLNRRDSASNFLVTLIRVILVCTHPHDRLYPFLATRNLLFFIEIGG